MPPKGYRLDPATQDVSTIPAFIRTGVSEPVSQIVKLGKGTGYTAPGYETVAEANPRSITVYEPRKYDVRARDHEMTHEFQQTRATGALKLPNGYQLAPFGISRPYSPEQYSVGDPRNYTYGGEAGLVSARNGGKTMADFNMEQQAEIVADYKAKQDELLAKARSGTATAADLRAMYQTRQAYHPFVQQLSEVPSRLRDMLPSVTAMMGFGTPHALAPAPNPPELPSYDTPGLSVIPADPLLGGKSVAIRTPR